MRVLQLVTTPRPFFQRQVDALESVGVDVTTVSVPRPDVSAETGGRSARHYLRFYASQLETAARGDFDLVHANYGLVGPAALAQPVRPLVLTLWGSDLMGADWLARLSRATARRCDAVVAPSRPIADRLDVPTHLVPFGVDTGTFRPIDRDLARDYLGWDPDDPVVLFPYPGERDVKDVSRARRVVDALPMDADLRRLSGVPHEEVPLYMNASDAVLVTSRRESGPMVVKEAVACDVPVVSTDVGFVASVLDGIDGSFVCASTDALVEALATVLRAGRRPTGHPTIDGIDGMGERLVDLYEAVLVGRVG